ncbi:MAG TPA: IS1595 family transposase [Stellaceae bacterium]|jgi:transposase-like protein|nr:IS1595 family transposase [Stellaceae bacterium]
MAINLTDPIFTDERKAREHMEAVRWPDGVNCPHCGNLNSARIYRIAPNEKAKIREGLFECQDCHGQFTVQTGTVMESSHVPLNKWVLAYRLMASAKKGISAHQMHRTIGVTYKTAWFMCHRIRESMRDVSGDQLGGAGKIVEGDETYVGGKPRRGTNGRKTQQDRKTPVAVLVERGGRVRATVMSQPIDGAIKRNIAKNVAQGTEMHTDEHKAYKGIERITGGMHFSVTHYLNEFAKEDIHNNTAESWNALLKRSIVGSFHHVSREHLSRYCDEVSFRWDRRSMDDSERTDAAIKGGEGKRLTYRNPSSAPQA